MPLARERAQRLSAVSHADLKPADVLEGEVYKMANDERTKLLDLARRGREVLSDTRDPAHRRTISDLLSVLEAKLAELGEAVAPSR